MSDPWKDDRGARPVEDRIMDDRDWDDPSGPRLVAGTYDPEERCRWVEALNLATVLCSGHGPTTILNPEARAEFLDVARWYYTNLLVLPGGDST